MSTADSSNKTRRLVDVVRVLVAVILGSIGAAAGFTHTHDWAVHHGQLGWIAWADAVVIEGIVIVAGFEIQRDHRSGGARKLTFPMAVLVAGFGVQMAAQVALAEPSPAGWLVAAMPALGFLVVVKLLMRRAPAPETPAIPVSTPDPEPVTVTASRADVLTHPAPPAAVVAPARPRLKLPAELTSRINTVAETARSEGRELTIEEIRRVVRVPEPMAVQILQDLATG
ncbi:DUF2637 domain-containing protein [Amycolatopsis sp. NPDC049252]|uniref:DUF2637 domain-containing protein n=1 Tax=Amycolatopsis sp. NPDC049252 TaxID=3363933 RepID=UPI00371D771B